MQTKTTMSKISKHRAYYSWQLVFRNPADFMWKHDIAFPQYSIKLKSFSWNIWFISFVGGFHMKSGRFHVKSARFHEIRQISWNPVDFRWNPHEIQWISPKICQISWNLLDFTWNLPDFMKSKQNPADFMWNLNEIRRISWMWAFGWSPSIGLLSKDQWDKHQHKHIVW